MRQVFDKEALECAIDKLREMAEEHMPDINSDIIIRFYCGTDGRPWKDTDILQEYSSDKRRLNRGKLQTIIKMFEDRILSKDTEARRTLRFFMAFRDFYWNAYRKIQYREQKREERN